MSSLLFSAAFNQCKSFQARHILPLSFRRACKSFSLIICALSLMNSSELRCQPQWIRIKRSFMYHVNIGSTLSPFMHHSCLHICSFHFRVFLKFICINCCKWNSYIRTEHTQDMCVPLHEISSATMFFRLILSRSRTFAFASSLRVCRGCFAYPYMLFVLLLTFISSVYTMSLSYFPLHLHFMFVLLRQTARMFAWHISVVCILLKRNELIA